jgi:hypothetical protein
MNASTGVGTGKTGVAWVEPANLCQCKALNGMALQRLARVARVAWVVLPYREKPISPLFLEDIHSPPCKGLTCATLATCARPIKTTLSSSLYPVPNICHLCQKSIPHSVEGLEGLEGFHLSGNQRNSSWPTPSKDRRTT